MARQDWDLGEIHWITDWFVLYDLAPDIRQFSGFL